MGPLGPQGGGPILPAKPYKRSSILSWVSDPPDSVVLETNIEFNFYENLATEAIATLAHLSRAVVKLETQAVEARSPAPPGGAPKDRSCWATD